ncbi:MAG TPA: sigma-70 family RNA polymerase sigma factor [Verrucomicrobia bacterium]|nr:sigma-70 family RNA polymerase sigma factor [Verrucomicrobiota bacterium]
MNAAPPALRAPRLKGTLPRGLSAEKFVSDFTSGRQPTGKVNGEQTDYELLRRYVRDTDQRAFSDLLRRHLDLVYGTAMRQLHDSGAAEEVSQNVFIALARKAWRFGPSDSLPAWLHRAALLASKEWLRSELRRRRREQTASELGTTMKTHEPEEAWRSVAPFLDDGLLSLGEKDRTPLLLRYYENHSLRAVGQALGVSEDAAQKRVAAALQKLTVYFQNRGFRRATPAIAGAALAHTFVPAPDAVAGPLVSRLAHTISSGIPSILSVMSRFLGWSNAQKGAAILLLAAASSVVLIAKRSTDAVTQEGNLQSAQVAEAESPSSAQEFVPAEPVARKRIQSQRRPSRSRSSTRFTWNSGRR